MSNRDNQNKRDAGQTQLRRRDDAHDDEQRTNDPTEGKPEPRKLPLRVHRLRTGATTPARTFIFGREGTYLPDVVRR